MEAMAKSGGVDRYPSRAVCDVCHHPHACYVGGGPRPGIAGPLGWELHVCLGCLAGAATPGAFATCEDGSAEGRRVAAGQRDA